MRTPTRREFVRTLGSVLGTAALVPLVGTANIRAERSRTVPAEQGDSVAKSGADETVTIEPVDNEMRYAKEEIRAPAGTELTIVFNNTATSPAMHHNVVVLKPGEGIKKTVGTAAMTAKENDFIPPDHTDQIIAHTPMAAPGEEVEVTFTVPDPGEYPYICTYPGHWTTMQGTLYSEEA